MARGGQRRRRTDKELFSDRLRRFYGENQQLVSNRALREALGWDEIKYNRIKDQLNRENLIVIGRGRGGSVGLVNAPDSIALRFFISYSHADETAKKNLLKHLEPLKKMKLIETWDDRRINAGENWGEGIAGALNEADVILLLISVDFINSNYCYDVEMERAMERHSLGQARVVPIIYRNCLWHHMPFAKFQALPKDALPIVSWRNEEDAYVNVVEGLKLVAEEILSQR